MGGMSLMDVLAHAAPRSVSPALLGAVEGRPHTEDEAYALQHALFERRGDSVGAWKVGAQGSDGVPRGAPIPARVVHPADHAAAGRFHPRAGLELEFYVQMGDLSSVDVFALDDATIVSHIARMGAAIEWVDSRFEAWPEVDKLLQLADLQNNGALIVGPSVPYSADFDVLSPEILWTLNGESIVRGTGSNPAGDPRRLIPWVVRQAQVWGKPITAKTVITTGTYTGIHFPASGGRLRASLGGLPALAIDLLEA